MPSVGYQRMLDPGETVEEAKAQALAALLGTEAVHEAKIKMKDHPHFGKKVKRQGPPVFTVTTRSDGRTVVECTRAYEVA